MAVYVASGYNISGYVKGDCDVEDYVTSGYVSSGYVEGCGGVPEQPSLDYPIITITSLDPTIKVDVKVLLLSTTLLLQTNLNKVILPKINHKVVRIGDVVLDYSMNITNVFNDKIYLGDNSLNSNGTFNSNIVQKGRHGTVKQVTSDKHGWLTYKTILALENLNPISSHQVEFDDGSIEYYHFDHSGLYISKENLYYGSKWYNAKINLIQG